MVGQSHILTASVENWPGKSHSRMSVDLFDVSNKPCEPAGRAGGRRSTGVPSGPEEPLTNR